MSVSTFWHQSFFASLFYRICITKHGSRLEMSLGLGSICGHWPGVIRGVKIDLLVFVFCKYTHGVQSCKRSDILIFIVHTRSKTMSGLKRMPATNVSPSRSASYMCPGTNPEFSWRSRPRGCPNIKWTAFCDCLLEKSLFSMICCGLQKEFHDGARLRNFEYKF